jgi:hypothetical protein
MQASSCLALIFAVTALATAGRSTAESHLRPSCSLHAEKAVVVAYEPVWLRLDCRSPASQATRLDFLTGQDVGWRVSPPASGLSCWSWVLSLPPDNSNLPPPVGVNLAAGEGVSVRVLLTRWARFHTPGSFQAALVDCASSTSPKDVGGAALTNQAAFEVAPLDEARLKATCEELVSQALASNTSAQSPGPEQAAEALSWIDLPLAVPYLERLLLADRAGSALAVQGLGRIADQAAAAALIRAYDRVGVFSRLAIRGELMERRPRMHDPELRKRLDFILSEGALRELVPASLLQGRKPSGDHP